MTAKPRAKGKKKGGKAGGGPAPGALPTAATSIGLFLARIWTGVFFLVTAEYKLNQPGMGIGEAIDRFREKEYLPTLEDALAHPPTLFGQEVPLFQGLVESVAIPNAGILAPTILIFEALLGLCLVLGLGVRLMAGLGVLLMLLFNLAKVQPGSGPDDPVGVFLFTVRTANWPVTIILLLLCLAAAGRILGLDRWIRGAAPRWLRWIG